MFSEQNINLTESMIANVIYIMIHFQTSERKIQCGIYEEIPSNSTITFLLTTWAECLCLHGENIFQGSFIDVPYFTQAK